MPMRTVDRLRMRLRNQYMLIRTVDADRVKVGGDKVISVWFAMRLRRKMTVSFGFGERFLKVFTMNAVTTPENRPA